MIKGTIFRIKKYALHDGPGIRTTVFFKGCPLSCLWCHNPEGIDPRPQTMSHRTTSGEIDQTVGSVIGVDALVKEIEKDVLFYDESGGGVTFSGGEPLAQSNFLKALLRECNHREIHTALDTSGFASTAVIDQIFPLLQLVLFDLKIMDVDRHRHYTGVSNRMILDNLKRIARSPTPVRIRVPLVPGVTDSDDNLREITRLANTLKTLEGVDLLPFHRIGEEKYRRLGRIDNLAGTAPPSPEQVTEIKNRFQREGLAVTIGG